MNTKDIIIADKIIRYENYQFRRLFGQANEVTIQDVRKYLEEDAFSPYEDLSDDALKLIYSYIESDFNYQVIETSAIEAIKELSPKEQISSIISLTKGGINLNYRELLSKDEKKLLFDNMREFPEEYIDDRNYYINQIAYLEDMIDYINLNGKNKEILAEELLTDIKSNPNLKDFIMQLDDDFEKAKMCVKLGIRDKNIVEEIEDAYLRIAVLTNGEFIEGYSLDFKKEFLEDIREYKESKEKLDKLETEEEKTEYIITLSDNDMKIEFLKSIKDKDNRDKIIDSLQNEIQPELKNRVELVQKMITEFFEDSLGKDFTDEKREIMEMTYKRTRIVYSEMLERNTNGTARYYMDDILMNPKNARNPNLQIEYLIHEYGHMFSNFYGKECGYFAGESKALEEGMQDLFSELVINHYMEKHGSIELDGRKIRMDYPLVSHSRYHKENGWQRTMLYPLQKEGLDIIALAEYQLGDKNKYLELTLGKENAEKKQRDSFGNPNINTSQREIYEAHKESFKDIDRTSIYYTRNWLLPAIELQTRLEDKGVDLLDLSNGIYYCKYIAKEYFEDRELYEIDSEELQFFVDAVTRNRDTNMIDYDDFANDMIHRLSETDLEEHSYEILKNSDIIWYKLESSGIEMQEKFGKCFSVEQEKVYNGQDIGESLKKYRELIPAYLQKYSKNKNKGSNELILEYAKDLQYAYLDQLDQALEEDREGTIKAITEAEDSEIWIDKSIAEVLDKHGVVLESTPKTQGNYSVDDVTRIAIKGKFTLGEIEGLGIALESTKESESIRNNETR